MSDDEQDLADVARNILRMEAQCTPAPWKTLVEFGKETIMVHAGSDGETDKTTRLVRNDLVLAVNMRNHLKRLCNDYLRLRLIVDGNKTATKPDV